MAHKAPQPSEIAVIGAGVSGLVAARRLAAEGFRVTIYERRKLPGGVWNYTKDSDQTGIDSLVMTAWHGWGSRAGAPASSHGRPTFASAVYQDLETNFPRQLMELQDHAWTHQPLFMSHSLVYRYLLDYAKQMPPNVQIRGDKEVVHVYYEQPTGLWKLTFRDVSTGTRVTKGYRAVVVAVGVFDKPFVPDLRGLREWNQQWPDSLSHSKTYRNPESFRRKKVVIVGYGASGFDIASKVSQHASQLWISTSDKSAALPPGAQRMPRLVHLDPHQRRLRFEGGAQVAGVDRVIFCTGYSYSQPFLRATTNGDDDDDDDDGNGPPLFPDGPTLPDLHEHVLYIPNPTLAFLGLVKGAVPTFLIVQAQAAFLARVWAGRDPRLRIPQPLPTGTLLQHQPQSQHLCQVATPAEHRQFLCHELPHPKFIDYLLGLEVTCLEADGPSPTSTSRSWEVRHPQHVHSLPCRWTLEHEWILQHRREIRARFFAHSPKERQGITSLAQLSFFLSATAAPAPAVPKGDWYYNNKNKTKLNSKREQRQQQRTMASPTFDASTLPFVLLHAGYFSRRAQQRPLELPYLWLSLPLDASPPSTPASSPPPPPTGVRYVDPAFWAGMLPRSFWAAQWRTLGTVRSRATLVAGARRVVKVCRAGLEGAVGYVEGRMAWSRPGRHLWSLVVWERQRQQRQQQLERGDPVVVVGGGRLPGVEGGGGGGGGGGDDEFARLETLRRELVAKLAYLNALDENLASIIRFDEPEIPWFELLESSDMTCGPRCVGNCATDSKDIQI